MPDRTFSLTMPDRRDTSVIFASPHSGNVYPAEFLDQSVLDKHAIRSSEDAHVDRLFSDAPRFGAPLLAAVAPRAFIDLNRAPDEMDPAVVAGAVAGRHNPRVSSGLGVIPRVVAGGRAIYRGKLDLREAERRVGTWWRPYHDRLQRLIDESQFQFGEAILIDCHSMPHEAIEAIGRSAGPRPQVVLGDRFGAAAHHHLVDRVEAAFASAGLTVSRNAPFAGAFVTQHYGRPARNQHAVQIELDRSLYMDELTLELRRDFDDFCALIAGVIAEIADIGRKSSQLAAE